MMRSSSLPYNVLQLLKKRIRFDIIKLSTWILFIVLPTILFFFILCSQNLFKVAPRQFFKQKSSIISLAHQQNDDHEKCDLFKGQWVSDTIGSLYTNWSCKTIPESRNCFKNGRSDREFLNWRWKPDECELPRFHPKLFLRIVRGKKMAFIGDSIARNHMESLLCLLSEEEVAIDVYKDSENRFCTWHFPRYDFTLKVLWSKYLVTDKERVINGSNSGIFDLRLDKVDEKWSRELSSIDFAITSGSHWFFRKLYLHKAGKMIGCVYCNEPNVTKIDLALAIRMSFRTALDYINSCKECNKIVTFLRTISPSHLIGVWNNGGRCNRTRPLNEDEVDLGSSDLEIMRAQVEEVERARGEKGRRFEIMDITRAMLARPDGHPGSYWDNKWMKGYNDCTHWCLPGPIDAWNDFLMAMLKKEAKYVG